MEDKNVIINTTVLTSKFRVASVVSKLLYR